MEDKEAVEELLQFAVELRGGWEAVKFGPGEVEERVGEFAGGGLKSRGEVGVNAEQVKGAEIKGQEKARI
jgi:predicted TPR repeat methyltransferase